MDVKKEPDFMSILLYLQKKEYLSDKTKNCKRAIRVAAKSYQESGSLLLVNVAKVQRISGYDRSLSIRKCVKIC